MTINQRVFELLGSEKSKQIELAKALGISASTLNSWKVRGSDPPARYICAIADFFSVSIDYVLTGKNLTPANPGLDKDESALLQIYRCLEPDGRSILLATAYQEKRRLESAHTAYTIKDPALMELHEK